MRLAAGVRLGPYEVLGLIGAGGMAEVYRARDTRLGREVAVKVVSQALGADEGFVERFEREARLVGSVDHPNVVALHDVGVHDGKPYFVTELLQGETLRTRLNKAAVPLPRALDWAVQMAEGLAAAHERGIVHRDLKPENVLVTRDRHVKLLDFGIAKVIAAAQEPQLSGDAGPHDLLEETMPSASGKTATGTVMGTPGYMSPEQVRGGPVDARSDLFSLGAVLYELLSGRRAFPGASAVESGYAVLHHEPEPLPPTVPPSVAQVVHRCLEKDPEHRLQSARDLCFDLERLSSAPVVSGVKQEGPRHRIGLLWSRFSVAAVVGMAAVAMIVIRQTGPKTTPAGRPAARIVVLPFENLGGGEDGYFAAGITEEITSRLASIRGLAVISRTTATQYDRRGKTVEQIGKDLGVGYVLEGSVRWDKSGGGSGRVRITPQLIRVSDDTHLWTDRYDRQLSSIFAIQGEVADGVIRALNLTIGPSETAALRHVPTRDLDAYDLYLRAGEMWKHQERSAIAEQIRLTAAAFERDPQFAEALALLARGRLLNYWLYYDRRESELERARGEAERAVALRPDSAESHLALGYYNYYGRLDYEAALAEFRKVLALQPNEASVHAEIGYIKRRQGKLEEAEAELQKAFDGDPKNGKIAYNLGETQLLSRKYPEAIRTLDISTLLSPKFSLGYTFQAWAHLLWHGDLAAAERVVQMAAGIQDLGDSDGSLDYFSLRTALLARDWKRALEIVDRPLPVVLSPGLQFQYLPRPLLRAEVQSYAGRQDLAQASYEEARRILVAKLSEDPKDAHFHSSLGIALAGLRQTGEAVREGERAVELMPPEREAYRGILRIEDLALIQTMVGNQEAAIKNLDLLLSRPSWISVPLLRLDPRWDPLRKNPRFESLLAKYEVRL